MTIALITANQALQRLLEVAFQKNDFDYVMVDSMVDIDQNQNYSLYLIDYADQKTMDIGSLQEKGAVFALCCDENNILEGDIGKFNKIFECPLRLGRVFDEISYFLRQKIISEALKPIEMGDFCLDPKNSTLFNQKTKKNINLTEKEQSILLYLYAKKGERTPRSALLGHVWRYADNVETHTLETHIYRLRQKIEKDPATPEFLMTDDDGYYLKL
jgi:DNA-binding response OmpR family regulator